MVGAGKIIAVDVLPQKLAWAEEFGATHCVDASKEDPIARIHALAGGGGVDYAFEVVGLARTIEQALASTHRGGTAVVVGVCPAGTRLSIDPTMFLQQRTLTGTSFGGGRQRTDVQRRRDVRHRVPGRSVDRIRSPDRGRYRKRGHHRLDDR